VTLVKIALSQAPLKILSWEGSAALRKLHAFTGDWRLFADRIAGLVGNWKVSSIKQTFRSRFTMQSRETFG
jgi:hypothetical protein